MDDFTELLQRATGGEGEARERLAVEVYDELRSLARREMAKERPDHTLQPTALVHEAYLRLVGDDGGPFEGRAQFWSAAARALRRILVEHARRRGRVKRGGDMDRVELDAEMIVDPARDHRVLALDDALRRLEDLDPQLARLVELRFFAGMTLDEAGQTMGVSQSSVVRQWRLARAWLQGELGEDEYGR